MSQIDPAIIVFQTDNEDSRLIKVILNNKFEIENPQGLMLTGENTVSIGIKAVSIVQEFVDKNGKVIGSKKHL